MSKLLNLIHPLCIYKDKFNPSLVPILTGHTCDMERLVEIQHHKVDKEHVLNNLYRNQLPRGLLNAIREWTKNQTSLMAVEVSMPVDGCNLITVSNRKGWVTRAIQERVTHLSDDRAE